MEFHLPESTCVAGSVVLYMKGKYLSIVKVCSEECVVTSATIVDCGSVGVHLTNVTKEGEVSTESTCGEC